MVTHPHRTPAETAILAAMDVTPEQRRTMVALACRLAWADGIVTDEEREFVTNLVNRIGGGNIGTDEVDEWLSGGGPEADAADLPEALGRMFVYEAMQLMEADGEIAEAELKMLDGLVDRLFATQPPGATLGRIALKRRES
jgi:hypothetical protein